MRIWVWAKQPGGQDAAGNASEGHELVQQCATQRSVTLACGDLGLRAWAVGLGGFFWHI